jgi:hypothetical protein
LTNDVSTNSLQPEGVRQAKEGLSMSLWTAEDYDPLPPGLYVGKLLDIESREHERRVQALGLEDTGGTVRWTESVRQHLHELRATSKSATVGREHLGS